MPPCFYIDNRETALKTTLMQVPSIAASTTLVNLDIGDVAIADGDQTKLVFERKSLADLAASIKDGRHREQKARLLEWRKEDPTRQVYYVIEGYANAVACNATITSSVINTMFRDKIPVILMQDTQATCTFFTETFARFLEDPSRFFGEASSSGTEAAYISQLKMKKNKNITPTNVFIFQLSQIPGISTKIAAGIAATHPTMSDFVRALDALPESTRAAYVENIVVGEGRRVGKKTAQKIVEHI